MILRILPADACRFTSGIHLLSISKLAPILFIRTSFQREILNSTPYHHGRVPRYEAHAGLHPAPLSGAGEDKEEEEGREDSREPQSQVHLPQPARSIPVTLALLFFLRKAKLRLTMLSP